MTKRVGFMKMSRPALRAIILEQDKIIARSGDQMTDLSNRVIDLQRKEAQACEQKRNDDILVDKLMKDTMSSAVEIAALKRKIDDREWSISEADKRSLDLEQDLADAVQTIKELRSERSELRQIIKALESKVTRLEENLQYSRDERAKDNEHSRIVCAELNRKLQQWKELLANEVLENCNE